jgi:hypothetical protein
MTEDEVKNWLGLLKHDAVVKPEIVNALKPFPPPKTDAQHLAVFRAFLASRDNPSNRVIPGPIARREANRWCAKMDLDIPYPEDVEYPEDL